MILTAEGEYQETINKSMAMRKAISMAEGFCQKCVSGVSELAGDGKSQTTAACENCGSHEVVELAGRFLCSDCVAVAGSACAGPGRVTSKKIKFRLRRTGTFVKFKLKHQYETLWLHRGFWVVPRRDTSRRAGRFDQN